MLATTLLGPLYIYIYIYIEREIEKREGERDRQTETQRKMSTSYKTNRNFNYLVGRVFANGPRDRSSIPGRVIPKTFKMVLDTSLLNTRQYKVRIKGKVE